MEDKKLDNLSENNDALENSENQTPAEETVCEPAEVISEEAEETTDEDLSAALAAAAEAGGPSRKEKFWKEVREWIVSLAVALLVVFVLRTFLFTIIRVDGTSMADTLDNGERLFVTVYDAKFGTVERGDVVICYYPERGRTNFVKRVVAVPGDQVYRENGVTHVVYTVTDEAGTRTCDEALDPKKAMSYFSAAHDYEPYTLGDDEYFVVGDNRYNSHDSRDWNDSMSDGDVGPISGDMIIGHVRAVFWPLDCIRTVE